MNLIELQNKLLAAARKVAPGDRVPYAFEKRVMAHLGAMRPDDLWALWATPLWRGAMVCVVATVLLSAWSLFPDDSSAQPNLSQIHDSTVFVAAQQLTDSW